MGFGIPNGRLALSLWLLGIAGIELCAQEVDVGPPRLTEPSFTQIVNPRGVASVAVRVEGEAPFSYDWYKSKKKEGDVTTVTGVTGEIATYKGNPDGSVNISLIIEDINEEDQGYYWVVVKNDHGEAKSIKAELDVNDPPEPKDDGVLIPPGGGRERFFSRFPIGATTTATRRVTWMRPCLVWMIPMPRKTHWCAYARTA